MDFLPAELQQYVEAHSQPETDLLAQIRRETHLHVLKPRMLSGHLQGRVLSMISHIVKPSKILEIGTYTGYATLCLAEGLQANGRLITIDSNQELSQRTQANFNRSKYCEKIEMKVGNAMNILPTLDEPWDMVFIDADKKNYGNYFDLVIDKLKKGGLIIVDNVLWSGKVFDDSKEDKATAAIRAFNLKVHADVRVQNVLFPIRDGLMMLRKL